MRMKPTTRAVTREPAPLYGARQRSKWLVCSEMADALSRSCRPFYILVMFVSACIYIYYVRWL